MNDVPIEIIDEVASICNHKFKIQFNDY